MPILCVRENPIMDHSVRKVLQNLRDKPVSDMYNTSVLFIGYFFSTAKTTVLAWNKKKNGKFVSVCSPHISLIHLFDNSALYTLLHKLWQTCKSIHMQLPKTLQIFFQEIVMVFLTLAENINVLTYISIYLWVKCTKSLFWFSFCITVVVFLCFIILCTNKMLQNINTIWSCTE